MEFLHNCSFLIDDVMDGDRYRRQRETVWMVFGRSESICAAIGLLTLANQSIMSSDSKHKLDALLLVNDTTAKMLSGQALDLSFGGRTDVALDQCIEMATLKTSSLLSCATSIGATLLGAPSETIDALTSYGFHMGLAFQSRNDMIGIWGAPEQSGGRPMGFDLRARKVTLPVSFALQGNELANRELHYLIGESEPTDDQIIDATALVERLGGREWAVGFANSHVDRAMEALEPLRLPLNIREEFEAIANLGRPDDM